MIFWLFLPMGHVLEALTAFRIVYVGPNYNFREKNAFVSGLLFSPEQVVCTL